MATKEGLGDMTLTWGEELIMTCSFITDEQGRALCVTALGGDVAEELVAALTLSSVVSLLPPDLRVKILSVIAWCEETYRSGQDTDFPF